MKPRPDLLDANSPGGLEVIQLTGEPNVPASHVYMEAQIFTPDSKRFVLHRSANPHGSDRDDPQHKYLRCDIEDGCRLTPLTHETGATAPSVSPDGQWLYYFVNETGSEPGKITVKRVGLDGCNLTTLAVIDAAALGEAGSPSSVYPLSTISSDGKRLSTSLGTSLERTALVVVDPETGDVTVPFCGPSEEWSNTHPQYCRSADPEHSHDILVQHRHGIESNPPPGHRLQIVDVHVIRDDGTGFRCLPWGMDGTEYAQGHQCWRGRSAWAFSSTVTRAPLPGDPGHAECRLIESLPLTHDEHAGCQCPNAVRNELSRTFENPQFYHFGVDLAGRTLITDHWHPDGRTLLYLTRLHASGRDPARPFTYLLDTRADPSKTTHVHPFVSPDGAAAFFNSDESGQLQAYMIRGLACLTR